MQNITFIPKKYGMRIARNRLTIIRKGDQYAVSQG